jgi:tetratricopeptide (TPR) repeat protein
MGLFTFTSTRAPLTMYLHSAVYHILHPLFGAGGELTFSIVSFICGTATLAAWLYLARFLQMDLITTLLLGFMWSGIGLFFGYVEAYSVVVAVSTWMLVLGFVSLRSGKFLWWVVLLGLAAPLVNFLAVVYLPALAAYGWWGWRRKELKPGLILALTVVAFFVAMVVYFSRGWEKGTNVLLPLLPTPASPGAVFTLRQLLDLLNTAALTCGPLLALFALGLRSPRHAVNKTERSLLLLLILFPVVALIMHNPQIGMASDWDISASLLVFVPVLGMILWKELALSAAARLWIRILCAVWLVLLVAPAVRVQNSESMSLKRFVNLLAMDPDRAETGWDYLSSHYLHRGKLDEWGRCNQELLKHSDNPRYHTNLALYCAFKCQWTEATEHVQAALRVVRADGVTTNWEKRITDPSNLMQLGQKCIGEGRAQDAANTFALAADLAPYNVEPLTTLLDLFIQMRDMDRAMMMASQIARRDATQQKAAQELFRKQATISAAPQKTNAYLSLSMMAVATSDLPAARAYVESALAYTRPDSGMFSYMARLDTMTP